MTRRPRGATPRTKPAAPKAPVAGAPDEALLRALQGWFSRRSGGEQAAEEALSGAARGADRWRLKQSLERVFRHYGRLGWLLERQGETVTAEWLWAAAAVVLDRAPLESVAKRIAVTSADVSRVAGKLGRMSNQGIDHPEMANPVRQEIPEEFYSYLSDAYGPSLESESKALNMSAPVDIRVNTLKGTRDALAAELAGADIELRPTPYAPLALRARGTPDLAVTEAFTAGRFDMQDEGSQIVAALVDARPGQQVLDFCAGAGGKSLALAAAMENRGHLVAADTSAKRLARAKLRMKRAGAENAERVLLTGTDADPFLKRRAGWFDRVLVDAPCSGTGAWRRHPEAKWSGAFDLDRLTTLQDAILNRVAGLVKRGGRLVYATCSILPQENGARAKAFLAAHPGFRQVDLGEVWRSLFVTPYPGQDGTSLQLTPFRNGTDGFFVTVFERVA